jgi:hypothetical protein
LHGFEQVKNKFTQIFLVNLGNSLDIRIISTKTMTKIILEIGEIRLKGELNDSDTASAIVSALPLTGSANVWGEEIYFSIPVHVGQEPDAREEVNVGELAYWPGGNAFCIFLGPTPVSTSDLPRAISPVNVFGKLEGDPDVLKTVNSGAEIRVLQDKAQ